jgi:membrane associated rhomboid family serine protease
MVIAAICQPAYSSRKMIPISDDNPARLTPVITWALITLCIVAYLWERSLGKAMDPALNVLGFTPASYFSPQASLSEYVGLPAAATIFTSMFLHGGILHLAGNMLYLWIFGNNVEDAMGHLKFLIFYLVCGACAALTLAYIDPDSHVPMVGASGAISGVLAAYVLLHPRAHVTVIVPLGIIIYPFTISAIWVVGLWFLMQLINAAFSDPGQPGVAWWAHVGGFAAGLALTPILKSSGTRLFGTAYRGPWDR